MRSIFHLLTLLVSSQAGLLPADLPKNGDKDFETALNSFDTPKDVTTIEMEVLTQLEEVSAWRGHAAKLPCDYKTSPEKDMPVIVTWKVGNGPRFAVDVFRCVGYTKTNKRCFTTQILDEQYENRLYLAEDSPSLIIRQVQGQDNRNFWCQITLQDPTSTELGFDMKSVGLKVLDGNTMPKFHSVAVDNNVRTHVSNNVTLHCICAQDYHCSDVHWYKGPTNPTAGTSFEMVYSRQSHSRPTPTSYQSYNSWKGRTHLYDNSLIIRDVLLDDAGRYWCEITAAGFYAIGEMATDAKSVVLEVVESNSDIPNSFSCLGYNDGLYRDPYNCAFYYECSGGQTFHRLCPSGTVFNPNENAMYACDFKANVVPPCGSKYV